MTIVMKESGLDKRTGRGLTTYSVGGLFDGEWKDDSRGVLTSANGNQYDGEWKDSLYLDQW